VWLPEKKKAVTRRQLRQAAQNETKQAKSKLLQESFFWWSFFSFFLHSLLFQKVLMPTGHCLQTSGVVVLSFWPGASHPMQVFVSAMSYSLVDPYSRLPYLSRVSLLKNVHLITKKRLPFSSASHPPYPPVPLFHRLWLAVVCSPDMACSP